MICWPSLEQDPNRWRRGLCRRLPVGQTLDLGGDYYAKYDPERAMRRITRQANVLGFTVRFDPIEAA